MDHPAGLGKAQLRIVRPSDDLEPVVRFYRDGLGFLVPSSPVQSSIGRDLTCPLSLYLEGRELGDDLHPPDVPVQLIPGARAQPD